MASPSSLRRATLLLLLCAALATTWPATAAPRKTRSPQAAPAPVTLLDRAWSFLKNLWEKEGCMMDPSGRCTGATQPPAPSTDTGCMMDPSGLCRN